MAKHKVKLEFVMEVEADSQANAVIEASEHIPANTTNIKAECWTPKPIATETRETKVEASEPVAA